ncbi:short chain dehydrogenase [Klebsiella michiganensis]|nr:short chain dehydrogenase [Klebsiella michiganensis]
MSRARSTPASTNNVNQTQTDKPVENPGIAARFTLGPEAVVEKVRHAFVSDKPKLRYRVTLVAHAVAPAETPAADPRDGQNYPGLS